MHRERELEVGLAILEDLDEARELLGPDGALEHLDEQLLLDERVAEVRAVLDVLRCLLCELLEPVFERPPIEPDVRPVFYAFQPRDMRVSDAEDVVGEEGGTDWTMTIIMSFIST